MKHAEVKLTDVEPLGAVFYLRSIWIDGLMANVRLNPDGTNNLSSLASGSAAAPRESSSASVAAREHSERRRQRPAGNVAQQAVPVAGPSPAKSPMDFQLESFVLTKSGVNVQDNSGRGSGGGGAGRARSWSKKSSDAREIAGDVLREHEYSQRRRARGDGRAGSPQIRRSRPTCRSTRSICRRCSRSRRNFSRRRWRRASSARRPTCRRISRAIISTCMRSRPASRSKISKSMRRTKKKSRCSGKISASRSGSSTWRRARRRLPK